MSNRGKNGHDGVITATVQDIVDAQDGLSANEVGKLAPTLNQVQVNNVLVRFVRQGKLFRGKLGHLTVRFFKTEAAARHWENTAKKPEPRRYVPKGKRGATGLGTVPGPAKFATTLIGHEQTPMILPPGVVVQRIPSAPPRYQCVELLTDRPQPGRSGSEDFRQHQRQGRF